MNIEKQLKPLVESGFSGIWIKTYEAEEAQRDIVRLCGAEKWDIATWNCAKGVTFPLNLDQATARPIDPKISSNPLFPFQRFIRPEKDKPDRLIVILHNLHRFLDNPVVMQHCIDAVLNGKKHQVHFVVLSSIIEFSPELEKLFRLVEHDLPTDAQVQEIGSALLETPTEQPLDPLVIAAARGLTRREVEDAFALSIHEEGCLVSDYVWALKTQAIKKKDLLEIYRPRDKQKEGFAALCGLDNFKRFAKRLLRPDNKISPRGLLLLGVPGTGKSAAAKALSAEVDRPMLTLDMGKIFGRHVGDSEHNMHEALKMADAMAPCLLFVDEIEKALAGAGGEGDSGVATRLFGSLLTWLNDHTSDVLFLGTANDVKPLVNYSKGAFVRPGRFDATFFFEVPTREEKDAIWNLYSEQYQVEMSQCGWDELWTGAEIRACCRLAASLDIPLKEAAEFVIPVAVTAQDQIRDLRDWAKNRCLSASYPGLYKGESIILARDGSGEDRRRKVVTTKEKV